MINYFVSAENIAYHHWQIELLIESFKMLDLQNSLTIALAESQEKPYVDYTRNLSSHKKVFTHENVGRKNNCLSFNRIYSLYFALFQKIIEQPLVIIHPDTILLKPFEERSYDFIFQREEIEQPKELLEFVNSIKSANNAEWYPLGDTIFLRNIPLEFFRRVLEIANYLKDEKLGWILALMEYYGHFSCYGTSEIESILLDNDLKYLIHYKHGLPPFFNKQMFRFEQNTIGMGNPYDIIMQHNSSNATVYLQKVVEKIKSYRS